MIQTLFPITISQSILSDLFRCEVYFFRKWCQHLNSPKNSDLIAGGYFASACEITRKGFYNENLSVDEAIENGYNFILEQPDTGDVLKSNDRLAFVFKKYFQKFPLDKSWVPIALVDGTFSIEYYFEFDLGIPHPDLPERNLVFSGKLDLLAEKRLPGGNKVRAVVDEKTTKNVKRVEGSKVVDLAKEEELYSSSGQLCGYSWAAQQLGIDVEMAFIRRVPILANYEPAYELEIPITPFMVESWSKGMVNKVAETVERYKYYKAHGDLFSSFTGAYGDACNAYARPCGYKDGCNKKEGEEILFQKYPQLVIDPKDKDTLTITEFKQRYNL